MRRLRPLLLALAGSLVIAAPAGAAATPLDLGPGAAPDLVVDPSGAGHILFLDPAGGGAIYCRIPRNARACDVRTPLPVPGADSEQLFRREADGALFAVQTQPDDEILESAAGGTVWMSTSLDNGATFSAPAPLATGTDDSYAAGLAPDAQGLILLDGTDDGLQLRRAPFAGPDPRVLTVEDTAGGGPAGAGVANLGDGRMLVTNYLSNASVGWRVFAGGDPLDPAAWPARGILDDTDKPQLAAGPRGVFLLDARSYADQHLEQRAPIGIRSFDTKRLRWRAARPALADHETWGRTTLSQDARGRLHMVSATDGYDGRGCIMYARTGTKRSQWFGRTTILFSTRSMSLMPKYATAVAAPDGRGFAAWNDASGHVRATPLRQAKGSYRPIANPFKRLNCGRR